jgi:predicted DNA binding protein
MKYVQVSATPDSDRASEVINLLADAPSITGAQLYDWNLSVDKRPTALFEVVGDSTPLCDELRDTSDVQWFDVNHVTDRRFNLLVLFESGQIRLLSEVLGTLTREKLIATKPVIYRNGQIQARIVGSASVLQSAVRDLPPELNIEITKFGDFDRSRETPMAQLSPRQREALLEAFDLGYYEHPRHATHEDVAARLGCKPNTASEHLQKAERTIVAEALRVTSE